MSNGAPRDVVLLMVVRTSLAEADRAVDVELARALFEHVVVRQLLRGVHQQRLHEFGVRVGLASNMSAAAATKRRGHRGTAEPHLVARRVAANARVQCRVLSYEVVVRRLSKNGLVTGSSDFGFDLVVVMIGRPTRRSRNCASVHVSCRSRSPSSLRCRCRECRRRR